MACLCVFKLYSAAGKSYRFDVVIWFGLWEQMNMGHTWFIALNQTSLHIHLDWSVVSELLGESRSELESKQNSIVELQG